MQAAVIVAPRRAHWRSEAPASRMSGLASALSNGPGILNPIAGTTTQSGARQPFALSGTVKPCDVLTALRTPAIFTSKRGTVSPAIPINSFAVWNASSTADNPKSKTSSRKRSPPS